MRKVFGILLVAILSYLAWGFLQISYNLDGYANAMFSFFWGLFGALNGADLFKEFALFGVLALGVFGTFALSRREEKKIWSIVSLIMSIVSFFALING